MLVLDKATKTQIYFLFG